MLLLQPPFQVFIVFASAVYLEELVHFRQLIDTVSCAAPAIGSTQNEQP